MEGSSSSDDVQASSVLSSRYIVSEEHLKAKEQFLEKERENARLEAKRRKLMEKRVRIHAVEFSVNNLWIDMTKQLFSVAYFGHS